jgi:hypothetical protein
MNKLKYIYASAYSASLSIVAVIAMTLGTEYSAPFKTWLTGFTGHHWITKSWASLIVFAVMFAIIALANKGVDQYQTRKSLIVLQTTAVAGFVILLGFFIFEFVVH